MSGQGGLLRALKELAKRHWPALELRTILLGVLLFVATLPGFGAVFLRVYENALVRQTEAELIAQAAVLSAAYASMWREDSETPFPSASALKLTPEPPSIDLNETPILPEQPEAETLGPADPGAAVIGRQLLPVAIQAAQTTLAAIRLLDRNGVIVLGRADIGKSYSSLPEVQQALRGQSSTVLRRRGGYERRNVVELLSRAADIRVHYLRPVLVDGQVVGVVMLSRSPRSLFVGIYQDRGKILIGVGTIFILLTVMAGLLSRGIARPIEALRAATENVDRGSIAIPETPATAAVEIRDLYESFRIMADRIEKRSRYLKDLAAAVSHEFKTPISGIKGALELLDEHGDAMTEAERQQFVANASADVDRLSHLVQRLMDLARADMSVPGEAVATDLAGSIRKIADAWRNASLAVDVHFSKDIGPVSVPAAIIETVMEILLENSRNARASRIAIEAHRIGDAIEMTVADNGAGVVASDRRRLFEPFFTSRRAEGGTGLGLAIARSLLGNSGASIELADNNEGAAFRLKLPQPLRGTLASRS